MKKNYSLKIKLNIPIITIFLIIFILSSFIIIQRENQIAKETIISSARSYADLSISEYVSNYEAYYQSGFFKFMEITSNLMEVNQDIERIQIYNVNGTILFDSEELINGKYDNSIYGLRTISDTSLLTIIEQVEPTIIDSDLDGANFEIIQPYIDEWGPHQYSIRYIFSFSRLAQLQHEMVLIVSFYFSLFFIIAFISIFILFRRYVTKPTNILIQGVRKIRKGKFGERIEVISNDELGELASSFNDMTLDLKKTHQQLKQYSKNLEKLVDQKNQLIIQLSHDLKNPLGPITNIISLLNEMETDESKKELLEVLQRNAEHIKNLVIRTIEYIKINSSELPLHFQKTRLINIIEKIVDIKTPMIRKKNITFTINVSKDLIINSDVLYTEELLTNIIENAIIYNKENGKIFITAKKKRDFIIISIKDTGIGLEENLTEMVFDEFYKVDKSRHVFESSGLGLTIAKRIVELHGGKIWIESKGKNKGITIHFTLPFGGKNL